MLLIAAVCFVDLVVGCCRRSAFVARTSVARPRAAKRRKSFSANACAKKSLLPKAVCAEPERIRREENDRLEAIRAKEEAVRLEKERKEKEEQDRIIGPLAACQQTL